MTFNHKINLFNNDTKMLKNTFRFSTRNEQSVFKILIFGALHIAIIIHEIQKNIAQTKW